MAGFTTFQEFKDAIENGQTFTYEWYKTTGSAETAQNWSTSWATGPRPALGANPAGTPGVIYDNTAGGIVFPDLDGEGLWKYIYMNSAQNDANTAPGTVRIADRLVGVGAISLTSTGDKTVATQALPRYTDGIGVSAWLEITTTTATSAVVVSMNSYTNQDGTPGRAGATMTFPSTATNAGCLLGPLPLQDGDTGVKSVETINVATAGTAGVTNVILLRTVGTVPINMGEPTTLLHPLPYTLLPRVYDGATLFIMSIGWAGAEVLNGEIGVVYN